MVTLIAVLSLSIWVYLVAFHGAFWRSGPVLDRGTACRPAKVAAVVPARDEAENIRESLGSLLQQQVPGELFIILVDDNSTDGTGEIARSTEIEGRLAVIAGAPLPHGWSGKLWALHQGLAHPHARNADYVLLSDADVIHGPYHVAALVAKVQADELDLVSEMVRLHCETTPERALIPAFVFFFQMLYPFAWVADPNRGVAGAAGGTMLVKRAALDRIGGVSRIRHKLIDDCALAKQIKQTGGRMWLGHSNAAVSKRVYRNWRDVWNMIARTAYAQLKHSPWLLLGCVASMSVMYAAPPLLTLFAPGLSRAIGAAAWLIMALSFEPTLRRYGRSGFWGLALPGIAMFYLAATVASALRHYTGRGGRWKDRVYPDATT